MTSESDLIKKHQRMIYAIVRRSVKRYGYMDFDDYVSEANIAAMKAIRSFKTDKNAKLSSYISSCVINRLKDIFKSNSSKKNNGICVPLEDLKESDHPFLSPSFVVLSDEEKSVIGHVAKYGKASLVKEWRKNKKYTKQQAIEAIDLCFCRINQKLM